MQRRSWLGVGLILVGVTSGCSGDDPGPGSKVTQAKGGSGGSGGEAGSLSLGLPGGGGGAGGASGGGAGGASGASGSSHAGASAGGVTNQAGTSSAGGSGGAKPAGTCKRASGSDADCADFYPAEPPDPARPQAYACDDSGAYLTLNGAHDGQCASVSFVTGAKYGACCPP
jgi:hypothetical protein